MLKLIYTVIKENSYQDSISLMLLTNAINQLDGVNKVSIMMGTDANKDIFNTAGLFTDEVAQAKSSDMVVAVDTDSEERVSEILAAVDDFLKDLSTKTDTEKDVAVTNWKQALTQLTEANVALISIAGTYAPLEIENALDNGLHAFVFSDNVPIEEEIRLKQKAHEKGLLVMGPDCGTGIINGVPLAFTNEIRPGNIGIVGASGTGTQEVSSLIDQYGGGVTHAIGTGGRDLSLEVGAITMKDSIVALENDSQTDVIVVVSKPPATKIRNEIVALLQSVSKPVVAIFLGEKPTAYEGNVYFAHTLEEAARIAVDLAADKPVLPNYLQALPTLPEADLNPDTAGIVGLYSGGTLAAEAASLLSETLALGDIIHEDGYLLKRDTIEIIDLGDDMYTQGKPHPMIDPENRMKFFAEKGRLETTNIILFDVVIGYGAMEDPIGGFLPIIQDLQQQAKAAGRTLHFVATICGTMSDFQGFNHIKNQLEAIDVLVANSNQQAVRTVLHLVGKEFVEADKEKIPYAGSKETLPAVSPEVVRLLSEKPQVINIGIQGFVAPIESHYGKAIQFAWKPIAGGNMTYAKWIKELNGSAEVAEANQKVIGRIAAGSPFLKDVVPAYTVIPELKEKVLLHAGPPIVYQDMTGPMQGACVGAILFEKWATTEAEAKQMLENNEITFIPCHHVGAVGPMGGITSANMAVVVVENTLENNRAYCTMNEGIGKVLRFGAYSDEVVNRLTWMKDTLGPVLSQALALKEEGLNLNVLMAKAITMGDEFHQRNIAASLIFLKEMAPLIVRLDIEESVKEEVIQFLADTDQFFLNIMMAAGKSIVDAARKLKEGTVVTTMTRNGKDFGIRISGMGDEWFTAPVNTPEGLFFTGFSQEDANTDIGDSAITETVGVGAMAMIAAPGVTRFVGAGGFQDALNISNEMAEIVLDFNGNFSIPTWDFKGTCLGIDICKVVETGITPVINTGIAHKEAGIGQIGAGTVRAPLACFEKALEAYVKHLGLA